MKVVGARGFLVLCLTATLGCPREPSATPDSGDDGGPRDAEPDSGDGGDGGTSECLVEPRSSPVGGACGCIADCGDGLLCQDETMLGYPRGVCTAPCNDSGVDCPEGLCELQVGTSDGLCFQPCEGHAECRAGWQCLYGRCAPFCGEDGQCLSGHCDPQTRLCTDGTPAEGAGPLGACVRGEDCASRVCVDAFSGFCAVFCVEGAVECPAGSVCVPGLDSAEPELGMCLPTCTDTTECPGDFECLSDGRGHRICWMRA